MTVDVAAVQGQLYDHLDQVFPRCAKDLLRLGGHEIAQHLPALRVCVIQPDAENPLAPWVYVTIGLWQASEATCRGHEYMVISPMADARHVDTLATVALAHWKSQKTMGKGLDVGDPVPLGQGWRAGANCDHMMVTVPYPYGPIMENCRSDDFHIRLLWLLPVTRSEVSFVQDEGLEALEARLEAAHSDFTQIIRPPVA